MSPEKSQTLYKTYPDFFAGVHQPITKSLMAFGCSCGDGWYPLIDTFCRLTQRVLSQEKTHTQFQFVQIKEKFGGLRLYYDLSLTGDLARQRELQATVKSFAEFAEELSYQTCENTGLPGKLYQGEWYKTLCEAEAKKLGYLPPQAET